MSQKNHWFASSAGLSGILLKFQPWNNVHRLELLEEQLAGVRDLDGVHGGRGLACVTPAAVREQAAGVAHVAGEGIARDHQPLHQEHARSVGNQAVPFHLTQPQASVSAPTLRRLPCQHCARPCGAPVHLVDHHVLQLLIVHWSHEDVCLQALSSYARSDTVLALVIEASLDELLADIRNLATSKTGAIVELAL